jgi:glucose-1-phosphate thymidylyltransferase
MKTSIKIAIPMAGLGTRMRPHTWSKPKPLIALAGRTVLDYLLEQFESLPQPETAEFIFIVGSNQLEQIRSHMQANHAQVKVQYVVQEHMRGQSDALYLAKDLLKGPMLMCFSDTLIETDLSKIMQQDLDGIAWVKAVADPRRFGVAAVNKMGAIDNLVEKPKDVSNNLVLVGFYYFREGQDLMSAIETQMEQHISLNNEYFLADAVNVMLASGAKFLPQPVGVWLDAGKVDALLETNQYLLSHGHDNDAHAAGRSGVKIHSPVFIHPDARLSDCEIGPFASIASGCNLEHSQVSHSVLEEGVQVRDCVLINSLIGRSAVIEGFTGAVNIGDNSWVGK